MTPRYDIVLFDADDTLFDFGAAEELALRECLASLGFDFSGGILERYHAINLSLWEMLERDEIDLPGIQRRRFIELFSELAWQGDARHANEVFVKALERGTFLLEGAEELCKGLYGTVGLYLATNGASRSQRARLEGSFLKPYFSGLFISEELGAKKPQPAYFEAILSHLGDVPKDRILMVGDRLTADIAGAVSAGLDNCWFNPSRAENKTAVQPTYEVAVLSEITGIVLG